MKLLANGDSLKADSHIACHAHAAPMPCSDSAASFVKVRVVAGNIRTASPTVQQIVVFAVCHYHSLPRP